MSNISKDDPTYCLQKESCQFVVIKVKPSYLSTLYKFCCYNQQQKYIVHKWQPNDPKFDFLNGEYGKKIMKIKERSNWKHRCCIPNACKGYDSYYVANYNREVVYKTIRQKTRTFMCYQRPENKVYAITENKDEENQTDEERIALKNAYKEAVIKESQYVGKVLLPWNFTNYLAIVFNGREQPIFNITGSKYQVPFSEVFNISLFDDEKDKCIGKIYRMWSGAYDQVCAKAPQYIIEYPNGMDWKMKLLIISAVQMLDQFYFQSYF